MKKEDIRNNNNKKKNKLMDKEFNVMLNELNVLLKITPIYLLLLFSCVLISLI
jgi:hypothetical protein